jgi:hypothetical protein
VSLVEYGTDTNVFTLSAYKAPATWYVKKSNIKVWKCQPCRCLGGQGEINSRVDL